MKQVQASMLGSHHLPNCSLTADDLRAPLLQPHRLPSMAQALSPRVSLLESKEIFPTQSRPHPRDTPGAWREQQTPVIGQAG